MEINFKSKVSYVLFGINALLFVMSNFIARLLCCVLPYSSIDSTYMQAEEFCKKNHLFIEMRWRLTFFQGRDALHILCKVCLNTSIQF